MKIAIINTLYAPYQVGGAERSVEVLASGLTAAGVRVSILTLHEGQSVEREQRDGVDIWRLPLRNRYWPFDLIKRSALERLGWHLRDVYNFSARRDLRHALEVISPDLVHTNNLAGFSVSAWDAAAELDLPIVHTARDYYLLHPNSTLFSNGVTQNEAALVPRLWSVVKRTAGRKVADFVSISAYVRDIHRRNGHFPASRTHVVHNSVMLPEKGIARVGRPRGKRVFGFIGRLDASKGVECLLEAARRSPASQWLIAGNGSPQYVTSLKEAASVNVTFLGYQDPADFFSMVDVLVVPSLWAEPLGRVVLEAYAYGVPVLSSGLGGLAGIVEEDRTGWYFNANDIESLLIGMGKAQACDIDRISVTCLGRASDFSSESIAARYVSVYEGVLSNV